MMAEFGHYRLLDASRYFTVGAHIARPKCIGLDKWTEDEVFRLERLGNEGARLYWESGYSDSQTVGPKKPTPISNNNDVLTTIC